MTDKISIKTSEEIAKMKKGGKIAALVLATIKSKIKPGITTAELDQIAVKVIKDHQAGFSFQGFGGYPAVSCISVNNEVVHGLPSTTRILKDGDIVSVDVGVNYEGLHADTAATFAVGKISKEAQKLIDITQKSLAEGIKAIKPGKYLGDISAVIQQVIEDAGFGVVRDLTGHGVGKNLQEAPSIPNFGEYGTGPILKEGMTLAFEPMVTSGDWHIKVKPDGWTVITTDGSLSAHFEHTIAVTKSGAEILTKI